MDTYEKYSYCQEIASISDLKNQNVLPNMIDLGGIYLNNDVLEISMYDFVDRDQTP